MMNATIAIFDDTSLSRAGIRGVLNESRLHHNLAIIWESESSKDTITKTEASKPDILIISGQACDEALVQFVKNMSQRFPDIRKLLIANIPNSPEMCYQVLTAGIDGYVINDESPSIAYAITALLHNSFWFSKRAIEKLARTPSIIQSIKYSNINVKLTRKEQEVLQLLAMGHSNIQIAASLGIKERTVRYHLRNIYDKLGIESRYQAIAKALCSNT